MRSGDPQRWKGWRHGQTNAKEGDAPIKVTHGPVTAKPMSEKQAAYLKLLCEQTGEKFDPTLSMGRARVEITRLKRRRYRERRRAGNYE